MEKYCWLKSAISLCQRSLPVRASRRDEVIVRRLEVEPVAPHADAAIADVGAALGLPEVMPQDLVPSRASIAHALSGVER